jgi:hypothetical protein
MRKYSCVFLFPSPAFRLLDSNAPSRQASAFSDVAFQKSSSKTTSSCPSPSSFLPFPLSDPFHRHLHPHLAIALSSVVLSFSSNCLSRFVVVDLAVRHAWQRSLPRLLRSCWTRRVAPDVFLMIYFGIVLLPSSW